ncbi:MAG: immunoglobulin domain-containing protein [Opitutaceae bacterium]|nr:immunoglobulin domain-containing protein [Opitutaceae bacterium]
MLYTLRLASIVGFFSLLLVGVRAQTAPPSFVQHPQNATVAEGGTLSLSIEVNPSTIQVSLGLPPPFDGFTKDAPAPTSYKIAFQNRTIDVTQVSSFPMFLSTVTLFLSFGPIALSDSGTFRVIATNAVGSTQSNPATLTVTAVSPQISSQPVAQVVYSGSTASLSVAAIGKAPFTYQWHKDGAPITAATAATLTLANVQPSASGSYTVTITNVAGTVTSTPAVLTVMTPISRIINLSILAPLSIPGDSFTMGYVIGGNDTSGMKSLVLRAAGPSLGALGVAGTLNDPKLEMFAGQTKTGENDNWGGSAQLTAAIAAVGAFPYTGPTSLDAAAAVNITTRDNSMRVSATGPGTGQVIAEVYDATPEAIVTAITPRLINVSVLKEFGAGFTAGFVIRGTVTKTVLIRAIGPGLAAFGITSGYVVDPQIILSRGGITVATSDDWQTNIVATFSQVGAFALPPTSKDAALVHALQPGDYTVSVSGVGGATGLGLVEIYEVP